MKKNEVNQCVLIWKALQSTLYVEKSKSMKYAPKVDSLKLIKLTNSQLTDQGKKRKKRKTPRNNIRFGKEDIITDPTHIKIIIRQYYKQLYANKFDSCDKIVKIFKGNNLPKLIR